MESRSLHALLFRYRRIHRSAAECAASLASPTLPARNATHSLIGSPRSSTRSRSMADRPIHPEPGKNRRSSRVPRRFSGGRVHHYQPDLLQPPYRHRVHLLRLCRLQNRSCFLQDGPVSFIFSGAIFSVHIFACSILLALKATLIVDRIQAMCSLRVAGRKHERTGSLENSRCCGVP